MPTGARFGRRAGSTTSPAIYEVAAELDADLIVVGKKGMTGVRSVLGSVPHSVAHQAPCSVLIASTTCSGHGLAN